MQFFETTVNLALPISMTLLFSAIAPAHAIIITAAAEIINVEILTRVESIFAPPSKLMVLII